MCYLTQYTYIRELVISCLRANVCVYIDPWYASLSPNPRILFFFLVLARIIPGAWVVFGMRGWNSPDIVCTKNSVPLSGSLSPHFLSTWVGRQSLTTFYCTFFRNIRPPSRFARCLCNNFLIIPRGSVVRTNLINYSFVLIIKLLNWQNERRTRIQSWLRSRNKGAWVDNKFFLRIFCYPNLVDRRKNNPISLPTSAFHLFFILQFFSFYYFLFYRIVHSRR